MSSRAPVSGRKNQETASSQLKDKTARAFLIARDAVANLREFLDESSRMAFLTVKECERELDQIEREIDEQLPKAITRVGERKARDLLACLRFITDLERVGDLVWWIAQHLNDTRPKLRPRDTDALRAMAKLIISMLEEVHRGFVNGTVEPGHAVIARDREIDELRKQIFRSQLEHSNKTQDSRESIDILFMTQALERAGDHVTNLAEELIHLVEERSVRHLPKRISE
ncbi:MAG: PhoU domain-containing protein [Terriglobia bacterium]|jgi:phosphate transport system protein|nr:PhoU domain-containing protein [Terriglobia bacterium]